MKPYNSETMKKYLILLAFTLILGSTCIAQGIEFAHGSTWKEILAKAEKEDKLIFVDAYAEWCGPCKKMAKDVFTQKEVGGYFNANFVNVKMDMEAGEGPMLFAGEYRKALHILRAPRDSGAVDEQVTQR